jgi:hypothetical protein
MTPTEMLCHLRETVGHMMTLLDSRGAPRTPEINRLIEYNEQLLGVGLDLASSDEVESVEITFYALLQQYPWLKKLHNAASYAIVLDSCSTRVQYYVDLQQERELSQAEIEQKIGFEETLKQVQQKLASALDF